MPCQNPHDRTLSRLLSARRRLPLRHPEGPSPAQGRALGDAARDRHVRDRPEGRVRAHCLESTPRLPTLSLAAAGRRAARRSSTVLQLCPWPGRAERGRRGRRPGRGGRAPPCSANAGRDAAQAAPAECKVRGSRLQVRQRADEQGNWQSSDQSSQPRTCIRMGETKSREATSNSQALVRAEPAATQGNAQRNCTEATAKGERSEPRPSQRRSRILHEGAHACAAGRGVASCGRSKRTIHLCLHWLFVRRAVSTSA